jgi:SAM-dependent methyltransferase
LRLDIARENWREGARMERPDWAPADVDVERPSVARIYDYLLGGSHNFAADREMAHKMTAVKPDLPQQARANREFLHRAVRFLVGVGVRQFLDIGSGIPTLGNVHEIAQQAAPEARVAYVDIDPVAVAHSRSILAGNDRVTVIQEDLRRPDAILAHPDVRALLDLTRPLGVLLVAVLHAIPDADDPSGIVARLREVLVPGSYLVIGHFTDDSQPNVVGEVERLARQTTTPVTPRTRAQVERFFAGFDLVDPGLVWVPQWRPDSPGDVPDRPELATNYVGVGRKR